MRASSNLKPIPRAIVATKTDEVRDFLMVHLQDRGFAVELVHRAEYLRAVASGTDLLVADMALLKEACLEGEDRPRALLVLSGTPSLDEAVQAAEGGAVEYLALPFGDPQKLARTLDTLARAARAPVQEFEPAHAL